MLYCDASALVKLYTEEPHSSVVQAWTDAAELVATSEVAYVEVVGALARLGREGAMASADVTSAVDQWSQAWPALAHLTFDAQLAAELALRHPLRALDALQVAAALALCDGAPEADVAFASFDARQVAAARAEGLTVLEPPADRPAA